MARFLSHSKTYVMKTKKRKLALKKNTVRTLAQREVQEMQGGNTRYCDSFRWTQPCLCITGVVQ
jgi:hypothetical protein